MSDFREEKALGKVYDSRLARRLLRYLGPYRWWVAVAGLLTLPIAPLAEAGPKIFASHLDRYIVTALRHEISPGAADRAVGLMSLLFLATLALGFAFQYLQIRVMQKVGQDTMYD